MIVVDTWARVEYLRKTSSPADAALKRAVESGEDLGVVDVVRRELLAGAGSEEQVVTVPRLLASGVALPALSPATTTTRRGSLEPPGVPARPGGR